MSRFLPIAVMEQLLKEAGCSRVSNNAKTALKEYLEKEAKKVGKKAWQLAQHAGRRTVQSDDIKLATE
ncbi:NFYB/HAP3 family transcription factor subunit [Candidatus Woesearchaeota archaeon]|nr:NFYB/HAP3 family transcription factor subunit [Candidatus Woesearchaeota archaeon]